MTNSQNNPIPANTQIPKQDALIRRANIMIEKFDRYPLMPSGNLSIEFIQNVFAFNPLFVLDDLKAEIMDMLLQETNYEFDKEDLMPLLNNAYGKHERRLKIQILETLRNNYMQDIKHYEFREHSYMRLRPRETRIFYYAYSVYYIAQDLKNADALFLARQILKGISLIHCEKSTTPFDGIRHTGSLLSLGEFSGDRDVYMRLMSMIEKAIADSGNAEAIRRLQEEKRSESTSESGCYIATCIYGSYDCPQVWTLRRFRDYSLLETKYGQLFVKFYYTISPKLVKLLGNTRLFRVLCKKPLDKLVNYLQRKGIASTAYEDRTDF